MTITERVAIRRDGVHLAGILTKPARSGPLPLVVFVHGLGSSKESPRNVAIATELVSAGIATLLFDLSGHGESSDSDGSMDAYVADLEAAVQWAVARDEIQADRIGIAGSSLGAVIAAAAAAKGNVRPKTMVLRAPPMTAADLQRVDVPSLVLIGSHDPLLAGVRAGVAGCPLLTLSVVEGASHLFEEPGTLEAALQQTVAWFSSTLLQPSSVAAPAHQG